MGIDPLASLIQIPKYIMLKMLQNALWNFRNFYLYRTYTPYNSHLYYMYVCMYVYILYCIYGMFGSDFNLMVWRIWL